MLTMQRARHWLVLLIAAHSLGVGAILLLAPEWAIRFGGWGTIQPVFFARQAGIFHVVLVCGYLIEFFRYDGVTLMVSAKSIAIVFLLGAWLLGETAWAVPLSGVADGVMGATVWLVDRAARRTTPPDPSR